MSTQPIGVFDSGFGGLSVLQSLVEAFPSEEFIYLGDTARIPYGIKSPATVHKYLNQNLNFLRHLNCKAAVVACNTASTVLTPEDYDFPVIGVIKPGAALAAKTTQNKSIGVLATRGTVLSESYVTEISSIDPDIKVHQQACPLLVPLVEENWIDDPITNLIVYRYVSPLVQLGIDTLVLGCTHYPFLLKSIEKVTTNKVEIIRAGPAVAESLSKELYKNKLLTKTSLDAAPTIQLLTTDKSVTYVEMARRLTKGLRITDPELVEI